MSEPLTEFFGTWEEITKHEPELRGHQVKLTVLDSNVLEQKSIATQISFKGKPITDFDAYMASFPHIDNDAEFAAFEQAIAENRAERRQIARGRRD